MWEGEAEGSRRDESGDRGGVGGHGVSIDQHIPGSMAGQKHVAAPEDGAGRVPKEEGRKAATRGRGVQKGGDVGTQDTT